MAIVLQALLIIGILALAIFLCYMSNEDIKYLKKIPLLGIYKIKVKCKNIPWQIPVTWCMCNHNEFFAKLCLEAESHNSNAYIDPRVIEFLKKRGIYE